jgi:hypothetical protein
MEENSEGKRLLGRSRHGWEGNIKVDLKKTGAYGLDICGLAVGFCEHGTKYSVQKKKECWELLVWLSKYWFLKGSYTPS